VVACRRWVVGDTDRLAGICRDGAWQVREDKLRHLLLAVVGSHRINPGSCLGNNRKLDVTYSDSHVAIVVEERALLNFPSANSCVERHGDGLNGEETGGRVGCTTQSDGGGRRRARCSIGCGDDHIAREWTDSLWRKASLKCKLLASRQCKRQGREALLHKCEVRATRNVERGDLCCNVGGTGDELCVRGAIDGGFCEFDWTRAVEWKVNRRSKSVQCTCGTDVGFAITEDRVCELSWVPEVECSEQLEGVAVARGC
jgi:hypothetical protein